MTNTTDRQRVALETLNVGLYPMECRLHPIELAHHASRLAESADLERWVGGMACLIHDTAQWLALLSREPDADSGMTMSIGEAIATAHVHELGGYRPKVGKHRRKTVAESYLYMIHDWVRWGGIHDLTRIPSVGEIEKALRLPRSTGAGSVPKGVQLAQDIIESLDGVHPSDISRDIEREGVQVTEMLAASKDEGSARHAGEGSGRHKLPAGGPGDGGKSVDDDSLAILEYLAKRPGKRCLITEIIPSRGLKGRKAISLRLHRMAGFSPPLVEMPRPKTKGVKILPAGLACVGQLDKQ